MTRPPLTAARIAAAGLRVIDADGVKALTMRRVAGDLGVEAMSLYHHVPNKEALVAGVLDLLFAEAALPVDAPDVGAWVEGTAAAFRRLARTHPRAFPLLLTRALPLADPEAALPLERGMALFVEAGRPTADAFAAVQAVTVSMLSMALLESQAALDPDGAADPEGAYDLPSDRFPLLTAVTSGSIDLERYWSTLVGALRRGLS